MRIANRKSSARNGYNHAMNASDELRDAIRQMRAGDKSSAANRLRKLLDNGGLDATGQAAAHVWLAESSDDAAYKVRCLQRALELRPENAQIRRGLGALLAERPAPPGAITASQSDNSPRVLGIDGGANGLASGMLIADGILATTSYAVGGAEKLTISLDDGRTLQASMLRRYPIHDLALAHVPLRTNGKLTMADESTLAPGQPISALVYGGGRLHGALAAADNASPWLGANLPMAQLADAGGNPVYDNRRQLLGMLTRNAAGDGYALVLKVGRILSLAEQAHRESQSQPNARYCPACGGLAHARAYGGHTCEHCGAALPDDGKPMALQTAALNRLYGVADAAPCPHCAAQVGKHGGRCLRCGKAAA